MNKIDIITTEIKNLYATDSSGHDYWHTMRVYKNALTIANNEVCDKNIVSIAALLHDADDIKIYSTSNYQNAKNIMIKAGIDSITINRVIDIIKNISFKGSDTKIPETIEGKIVQDADRLDAMGAIGIARTFAYGGSKGIPIYDPYIKPRTSMNSKEYYSNNGTSINHFHEKLLLLKNLMNTRTAKKLAERRHQFLLTFLEVFWEECGEERDVNL